MAEKLCAEWENKLRTKVSSGNNNMNISPAEYSVLEDDKYLLFIKASYNLAGDSVYGVSRAIQIPPRYKYLKTNMNSSELNSVIENIETK